jgi:large subunit ribosomal protein L4
MPTVDVYNMSKKKVGTADLADSVFGTEVKEHLFYEVVRSQMANRRAGTHSTKTRAEVSGSNRKPFKQKGTGRARQGDTKGPIHVGGGIAFGPRPRDYSYNPPKKVRKAAVRSALSRRVEENKLWVLDSLELDAIKTKAVSGLVAEFGWGSVLLVDEPNENLRKSARNLQTVRYLSREGLNVYDILRHEHIVITQAAVESITGALAK